MRVLQLVQRPQRRGAEVFAYDLNRRFEALGLPVKTVYLHDFKGEHTLPLHGEDVCLHGNQKHPLERFPGIRPKLLRRVVEEISAFAPDIVQVNGSRTVKYGAASKQILRRDGWKLVYRNIGVPSDWHRWIGSILTYRFAIMPCMDGVVGVSRHSLENARALYRLDVPSKVILNGISLERLGTFADRDGFRRAEGVEPEDVVLLFVGFLERVKRADRFVRLIADLATETTRFFGWIVGDGPQRADCARLAEQLGVRDRIRFYGTQRDVARFMRSADFFVVTSETEGIPAVVLEAGISGLPVIATRVGGLPECILDGETGILVDPGTPSELRKAILELAGDPLRCSQMAERSRDWILNNLTIEQIADQYLEFYQQIHFARGRRGAAA